MILDQLSLKILRILFTVGNVDRDIGRHSGRYSVYSNKCWWTKSYIGRDTCGTTIDCVSTECRLTIDRLSTAISTECQSSIDPVSTKYRPSVDRVSTDYWLSVDRYIDRYLSCREMMEFFFWKRLTYSMSNNFSDLSQLNGNLFSHMSFNQKRKLMYNWHVIPCDVTIKESWD